MLVCEGLSARYGRVPVLHDVSLVVRPDEAVALIGPNGAGKTTTLKAILGLLPTARGRVTFNDAPLLGRDPADIVAATRDKYREAYRRITGADLP